MPRLTVIGSQSAGKSSLVEAVSGINVPRDSGTCTRCPMECSMSTTAKSWSCTIYLRKTHADDGTPLAAPVTEAFGPALRDKKKMEIYLRRAQAAILNPHIPSKDFLTKTEADLKNAKDLNTLPFSKNIVFIDVKDPDLTDLSFIDLPGLIQNSDLNDIALVQDLVETHIQGENTLILVAIPMSDDIQNQAAVRLAREADPKGERTIGVLTKPDKLTPGAIGDRKRWKEVIEGISNPLKHGYYCVRLPDDDERGRNISRVESQKIAAHFFENTAPWNTIADRNRFGVPNFVTNISELLVRLIENNLPKLNDQVQQLLVSCQTQLKKLPALSVNDPSTQVVLLITKFCDDFRSAVFGESSKGLVQGNRRRYEGFKKDIFRTRPNFKPSYLMSWSDVSEGQEGPSGPPIDVDEVKIAIADSMGWELPTHVPYNATKNYILKFTSLWDGPTMSCFEDIFARCSDFIQDLTAQHFGQFKDLQKHVASITKAELDKCKAETLHTLMKMLRLESIPAFTQNTEHFSSEANHWLQQYYTARYSETSVLRPAIRNQHVLSNHREYDIAEGDHAALAVMANVRAYFQVAYKRIIDYIPLSIEHELSQALANTLQKSLLESLLTHTDVARNMKAMLTEDPALAKRRAFLEDRRDRLLQIKHRLDMFGQARGAD
ncbi:P-loop containing nucleoside triphosphate hydrolase protein [Lyophyllum atratum]|nr:P-loop containing nucleoside triphosphate hydrolase protein [Lyophyllum atratum]